MKEKYICWKQEIKILKYANTDIKMTIVDNAGYNSIHFKKYYTINEIAFEIIKLINGLNKYEDVLNILSNKYHENIESIHIKVQKFIDLMHCKYGIDIDYKNIPTEKNVAVESKLIYPLVASVELTNKCNIKCMHCYGEFNNLLNEEMPLEKAKFLLEDLSDKV